RVPADGRLHEETAAIDEVGSSLPTGAQGKMHFRLERGDLLVAGIPKDFLVVNAPVPARRLKRPAVRFKRGSAIPTIPLQRARRGHGRQGAPDGVLVVRGGDGSVALGTGLIANVPDFRGDVPKRGSVFQPRMGVCLNGGGCLGGPPSSHQAER